MERSRRLDDDVLAEEIELYGDLVVAATAADGALPQAAIDRVLGLDAVVDDDGDVADGARGGAGEDAGPPDGPQGGGAAGTAGAAAGGA